MVERFRGKSVDGQYDGTISKILGLVNQRLKVMIASGDTDMESIELMGDKVLGHIWHPTEDEFVFRISVRLTPAKLKKRGQTPTEDLTLADITKLPSIPLTKCILLGFVNGQYDPMGLICPILIILKIHLRELFGPEMELSWDDPIPSEQHET